jgi:hypothetical protein
MKVKLTIIVGILILASTILSAFRYWEEDSVAKISFPLGNVFVVPKGKTKMEKAGFNHKLFTGDKVRTQKQARCEIKYNDGSIVRIDQESIYTITDYKTEKNEKTVESFLSIGKIWANIKKLTGKSDNWLLRGPSAVVAVRGTIYRMDANEDKSSQVLVYDGSVNVAPPAWSPGGAQGQSQQGQKPGYVQGPTVVQGPKQVTMEEWVEIVKAQQQITVQPDGSFKKSEFNLAEDSKNSWVQWNKERDKLIE